MKFLFIMIFISIGCNVIQSIQLGSYVFNNAIGAKHTNKKESNRRSSIKSSMKTNDKKSKDSSSKYGKRNKKMDVVLYNKKSNHQKGPTLKERLEKIAKNSLKQGQILSKEAFRRAKVVRSSAFESMLLKATWPNNDPVQPEILNEIIKYSIPAFKFSSVDSEDDPYYMTMHKLWTKMCEKDWRTISKSLYILHTITRDCQSDPCERFSEAIKDMVKTRNPKKPDHRYFDAKKLTELDDNSADYEEYTQAYAAYVIQRAKSFTSRFEEIDSIDNETSEKKVLSILKKAQQCIKLALQVEVHDKKLCNPITGYSTKLIALDLIDMWRLIGEKIAVFLDASEKTYANPQSSHTQTIADLLQFYKDAEQKITKYLGTNSKLYNKLKIKIPNQLEKNTAFTSDTLTARISQLTSISGGYINSNDISLNRVNKLLMSVNDRERIFIHKYSINNDEEKDEEEEEEDSNDDEEDSETNDDDDNDDDINEDSEISHDRQINDDGDIDDDEEKNQAEEDDEEDKEEVDDENAEEVEEVTDDKAVVFDNDDEGDVAIDNDENEQEEEEEDDDTNNDGEQDEEKDNTDEEEIYNDDNNNEVNDDDNEDEDEEDS